MIFIESMRIYIARMCCVY